MALTKVNSILVDGAINTTAAGNVGIGTTNPITQFVVSNAGANGYEVAANSESGTQTKINSYNRNAATFTPLVTDASQHQWLTAGTERMRITSSGNLLVGTTSLPSSGPGNAIQGIYLSTPFNGIAVRTTGAADSYECYAGIRNSTNGSVAAWWYNESTLVGRIAITSSATSYITSSDYRLKENIAPMTGALDKVAQLKPVTYTWKADGSNGQGFIAHELQEVCPDAVTGEKDAVNEDGSINPQGIDTSFLVATLTAAIQEQQAIITDLKARIETLEAK